MSTPVRPAIAHRSLHSVVALAFGAVFVLVGLSGFAVSGGHHTVGGEGGELLGLFLTGTAANIIALNGADNILHLVLGSALLAVGLRADHP